MTLHNYITRRFHDDLTFAEFDRNPNCIPDDILPNIVARLESHENCSPCRMNFICDEITNSLMKQ
jgi:hypothetical protein